MRGWWQAVHPEVYPRYWLYRFALLEIVALYWMADGVQNHSIVKQDAFQCETSILRNQIKRTEYMPCRVS